MITRALVSLFVCLLHIKKTLVDWLHACYTLMTDLHETLNAKLDAFVCCHFIILVMFLEKLAQRFEVAPGCVGLSDSRRHEAR